MGDVATRGREQVAQEETTRFSDLRREGRAANRRVTLAGVSFDTRLFLDLTIGLNEPETVFTRHGIEMSDAAALLADRQFAAMLRETQAYVDDHGLQFRARARALANEGLLEAYDIMTDPETAPAVRADLIKWLAKVGDLEPERSKDAAVTPGGGFNMSITFTGINPPPGTIIDVTPVAEPAQLEGDKP